MVHRLQHVCALRLHCGADRETCMREKHWLTLLFLSCFLLDVCCIAGLWIRSVGGYDYQRGEFPATALDLPFVVGATTRRVSHDVAPLGLVIATTLTLTSLLLVAHQYFEVRAPSS